MTSLDDFTRAYIGCALWSSVDEAGTPLDQDFAIEDLAPQALAKLIADAQSFQAAYSELLALWYTEAGESPERAGHDFWLTRNHHGAGFWDRWSGQTPQAAIGCILTDAAHACGECDLYVGDDGKIYF
jgi:hypothetical protein